MAKPPKKKVDELTTDEVIHKIFPKKVVKRLKDIKDETRKPPKDKKN